MSIREMAQSGTKNVVNPTKAVMGVRVEDEILISGMEFPPGINQSMRLEECVHASFQI